ncbi:hypothetical protein OHB14_39050 [Streptomyces sp. NBC_01613]|uniref:hypothetical protein n=1 Tax=Streptomyces sp. NBC_01613 TaxID=2975896 RepID=UPI0038673A92
MHSIGEAFNHHRMPLNLVEPPAVAIPTMGSELLSHTIYILGATHDSHASPLTEPFLNHPDSDVREETGVAAAQVTGSTPGARNHNS